MLYLGWIVAAFLGGFLLALWLWQRKTRRSLRERFSQVEAFQGRSYREVLTISGGRHYAEGLARGRVFHCAGIRRAGRVPRGYRRRSLNGGRETNANYH